MNFKTFEEENTYLEMQLEKHREKKYKRKNKKRIPKEIIIYEVRGC